MVNFTILDLHPHHLHIPYLICQLSVLYCWYIFGMVLGYFWFLSVFTVDPLLILFCILLVGGKFRELAMALFPTILKFPQPSPICHDIPSVGDILR
jgi:uncharacterized membrane protein